MIPVVMRETADGAMIFGPAEVAVQANETVRFVLRNAGELAHDFVLGDSDEITKHKMMMEMADDGHAHCSGNAIRLEARQTGDLVWQFAESGMFEFACLIPGHYEAGMKGQLHVDSH